MMALKIDDDVLPILRNLKCEGRGVKIVQQLDRKLYERVNKVLMALGGKWNKSAKAHLFEAFDSDEDVVASEVIADAVTSGEYVDARKEYQFFETPQDVIDLLLADLAIEPGMTVLEPSAGRGAIARACRDAGGSVECVEINEKMADHLLINEGFATMFDDFLHVPVPTPGVDRVGMNPPFTRSQDIDHVRRAYEWLKPGGRLVAVMGCGVTFREDRKAREFREFLRSCLNYRIEPLPPGSFKSSGTGVNTIYVVIEKGR